MDSIKGLLLMMLGVFMVLLIILAMQGTMAGEWTVIGQNIAYVFLFIVVFSVVVGTIAIYRK